MAKATFVNYAQFTAKGACARHAQLWANYEANSDLRARSQMQNTLQQITHNYNVSNKVAHFATLLWLAGEGDLYTVCLVQAAEVYGEC